MNDSKMEQSGEGYELMTEDFYDWLKRNHSRKLDEYSMRRHKKIVDVSLKWMVDDKMGYEDLVKTRKFELLNEYFSKPEFVPLSSWEVEEEQNEIIDKLNYYPIIVALSVEKGYFKYFTLQVTSGLKKIIKYKFLILEDGRVQDILHNKYYENYEEMKKYIILNQDMSRDLLFLSLLKNTRLNKIKEHIRKTISPKKISDTQVIHHFSQTKINFKNGSLYFMSYPLSLWSNLISTMIDDQTENSEPFEFDLYVSREIFVLYSLFRLTHFFEYKISNNILEILYEKIPGFPRFQEEFSKSIIINNIIELYKFCDYIEDKETLLMLIYLFTNCGPSLNPYEKQKFYDMIFSYYIQ